MSEQNPNQSGSMLAAGGRDLAAITPTTLILRGIGDLNWLAMLTDFFAPALIGNIIGGTALFALIAYAQVMKEI